MTDIQPACVRSYIEREALISDLTACVQFYAKICIFVFCQLHYGTDLQTQTIMLTRA